jgi:hypothetical protein
MRNAEDVKCKRVVSPDVCLWTISLPLTPDNHYILILVGISFLRHISSLYNKFSSKLRAVTFAKGSNCRKSFIILIHSWQSLSHTHTHSTLFPFWTTFSFELHVSVYKIHVSVRCCWTGGTFTYSFLAVIPLLVSLNNKIIDESLGKISSIVCCLLKRIKSSAELGECFEPCVPVVHLCQTVKWTVCECVSVCESNGQESIKINITLRDAISQSSLILLKIPSLCYS